MSVEAGLRGSALSPRVQDTNPNEAMHGPLEGPVLWSSFSAVSPMDVVVMFMTTRGIFVLLVVLHHTLLLNAVVCLS